MTKQKIKVTTPPAGSPLKVGIENGELVIRVGINTIAFVAEHSERFTDWNEQLKVYEKRYRVADAAQLGRDVVRALQKEEEDGTTPIHLLLDNAIEAAAEDGSLGFHE